jgi:hypothetical protein
VRVDLDEAAARARGCEVVGVFAGSVAVLSELGHRSKGVVADQLSAPWLDDAMLHHDAESQGVTADGRHLRIPVTGLELRHGALRDAHSLGHLGLGEVSSSVSDEMLKELAVFSGELKRELLYGIVRIGAQPSCELRLDAVPYSTLHGRSIT